MLRQALFTFMAAKATRSGQGSGHGQGQAHLNWDNYNLRGLNGLKFQEKFIFMH